MFAEEGDASVNGIGGPRPERADITGPADGRTHVDNDGFREYEAPR